MTNEEFLKSVTIEGEEWKYMIGFEDYCISSLGRIVSFKNNPFIMKTRDNSKGYLTIRIHKDGVSNRLFVHRIVAESFIQNTNKYPIVDHIDGNPHNNNYLNLRWCTQKMNMNYPIARKRIKDNLIIKYGSDHPRATKVVGINILNENDIRFYNTIRDAKKDGFRESQISSALSGKIKSHYHFKWIRLSDYEKLISKSKNS